MNYLQDQAVMNFAGTAARGSAIGTAVAEGMVSYLNDTDNLEVYRAIGTASPAWNPVAFRSEVTDLRVPGYAQIIAPTVNFSGGTATANTSGTVSFTNVSSISLNSVFTSLYRSYKIYIVATADTGQRVTNLRLRAGGADNTTTNWLYGFNIAATNATNIPIGSGSSNLLRVHDVHSQNSIFNFDVSAPNQSQPTVFSYTGTYAGNGISGGGIFTGSTVFDGFTFFLGAGVMTGTLQIYGYRE
jgi:hypothetical protein